MISKLFFALISSLFLESAFSQDVDVNSLSQQYGGLLSQGLDAIQSASNGSSLDDVAAQGLGAIQSAGNTTSLDVKQAECMKKLVPCQPYIQSPSPVPSTCCVPLKDLIDNELDCLCGVLNNVPVLNSFNTTVDGAVGLAKECGANFDLSFCKNATPPTASPISIPSPPQAPAAAPSTASPADEKSGGQRKSHVEKYALVALIYAYILLV